MENTIKMDDLGVPLFSETTHIAGPLGKTTTPKDHLGRSNGRVNEPV